MNSMVAMLKGSGELSSVVSDILLKRTCFLQRAGEREREREREKEKERERERETSHLPHIKA